MTHDERLAEARRLRSEHADILATPLVSEGGISPAEVGMMSERQRTRWQQKTMQKMDILAQIRRLERTDEKIAADEALQRAKDRRGRMAQLRVKIIFWATVGLGKRGKIKPTYVKLIEGAEAELRELEASDEA